MHATITIDKAGRVVLPKAFRDELNLSAGDSLELNLDGGRVTMEPARAETHMVQKAGFWVLRGGPPVTVEEVNNWIREDREARDRKNMGLGE